MKAYGQIGRFGVLAVLGVAAAEVLIMISPFATFFYASVHFESFLGLFSKSALTAWLDGFFLNHSVVTTSSFLEWQRRIGRYLFALGLWGFFISAYQVYCNKLTRRGVAKGFLYRFVRHPQYLCLAIAGWGLLTIWPRFLLLGIWVTMLFLYAGLSRLEERRMEERFGEDYREFVKTRGSFLPGSPVRRLFEVTFGRVKPRLLGWAAVYAFCIAFAFSVAFAMRAYTGVSTSTVFEPLHNTVILSAWPQPEKWMSKAFQVAHSDKKLQKRLEEVQDAKPIVVTILPPKYIMKGMYYKKTREQGASRLTLSGFSFTRLGRLAAYFLLPWVGPKHFMGVDPDTTNEPVQMVFSRAEKPYKDDLALEEAVDVSVRLTPLVVVDLIPSSGEVTDVIIPLPQNTWGPDVVMPIF